MNNKNENENKKDNEHKECSICLCSISVNELFTTPCNHTYHKKCIDIWKKKSTTCPMCRAPEFKNQDNKLLEEIRQTLKMFRDMIPDYDEQMSAIERFTNGQMSYAEMRSLCG